MSQVLDTRITSTAVSPDLDWSQVTETVRMLNLSVAQISMAMHEGEDSVGSLTASFTGMIGKVNDIAATADEMGKEAEASRGSILADCAEVQSGIQQTIVAFQFYDRLSQRLDHVKLALEKLSELVSDKSRLYQPDEWGGLQQTIRSRYTMAEEQEMFDVLLGGASIDEALDAVRDRINEGDIDDIELF